MHLSASQLPRRLAVLVLLASAVAGLLLALNGAGTSASATANPGPPSASDGPYLGAVLDWSVDSPGDYRDRLGESAAVYGYDAPMPLTGSDVDALRSAVQAADAEGASLLVTLLPSVPLDELDQEALDDVVADLEEAGLGQEGPAWVRPLPEMNASWRGWGQQPRAAVGVFRDLATAVHARLDEVGTVWQPVYGAGYPFGNEPRSTRRDAGPTTDGALDTNGDGRLTLRDDPYGPYWPGRAHVDWIGMSHYHWGESYPFVNNVVPPPGKLLGQLAGRYGYPDARDHAMRDFYARFVERTGRPMVLETSALHSPGGRRRLRAGGQAGVAAPAVRPRGLEAVSGDRDGAVAGAAPARGGEPEPRRRLAGDRVACRARDVLPPTGRGPARAHHRRPHRQGGSR